MNNSYTPLKEALTSTGQAYTMDNLKTLAASKGINNYTGTDAQNVQLAKLIQPSNIVSANDIKSTPLLSVPTLPSASGVGQAGNTAAGYGASTPNMADTILKQTNVELSPIEKQAQELQMKIANTLPDLQGESAALAQAKEQAGVNKFSAQLQDLNNQINIKTAEINKSDIQLAQSLQGIEDKPIAMEFITGEQASVQRNAQLARAMKVAEIGVLNAMAIAAQGNVTLAQNMAQQAVDAKYAPQKEIINTYKAQLEAIAPLLTAAEKKRANEQTLRTNLALKEIDKKQKDEEAIQSYIMDAQAAGAPASVTARAASAKTPLEAATILGKYSTASLKNELLRAQVATEKAQASKYYADASKAKLEPTSPQEIQAYGISPKAFSAGNKATYQNLQGVVDAATSWAGQIAVNKGDVAGLGAGSLVPAFLSDQAQQSGRTALNALSLKVAQWASGASLTAKQQEQVDAFMPNETDSDGTVKRKLNSLVGFMNSQINAVAKSEGQNGALPTEVDLFPAPNKFQQSLGEGSQTIPGTKYISGVSSDGTINFSLPTTSTPMTK